MSPARTGRWKVRKWRSKSGPTRIHVWNVFAPDGQWWGTCESWGEAMQFADDKFWEAELSAAGMKL